MSPMELTKGQYERQVLDMIYDTSGYVSVVASDKPDFRLRKFDNQSEFGVEVTELFQDEVAARIHKVPGYIGSILGGGSYLHKHDKLALNLITVDVHDADGNLKSSNVPGIIREEPSPDSHYRKLARVIERKTAAVNGYDSNLSHINLIVADYYPASSSVSGEFSIDDMFVPELRDAIRASPFRRVYLVSVAEAPAPVYRSLDLLLLYEAFMVFLEVVNRIPEALAALDFVDVAPLFVHVMAEEGETLHIQCDNGQPFAIWGSAGASYDAERGALIHDYADWAMKPPEPLSPLPAIDSELMATIVNLFRALREASSIMTTFAMTERL